MNASDAISPPLSMNKHVRNQRLYEHLLNMGLFVDPIYVDGDSTKIDRLVVSTERPDVPVVTLDQARTMLQNTVSA